jgi:hypothetical protein
MGICQPSIIRIAVTGHRLINIDEQLIDSIRQVLNNIRKHHSGANFYLYSALAEGSDQLIASIAQEFQDIKLMVPLPLPVEKYLIDFDSQTGKDNFHKLLQSASEIIQITARTDGQSVYQHLGDFLVEQSNYVVAVWNGEYSSKDGGTGDVVKNALSANKPVYWIYCNNTKTGIINHLMQHKTVGDIEMLG